MKTTIVFCLMVFSLSAFASKTSYVLDHKIPLEGEGGWDCLNIDDSTQKLFITRGDHVDVVDLKTQKVVGKISEKINGAHAVAFVPELNKGYATSGKSAKVISFDLQTLKVQKEIPAGQKADLIIFDKLTSKIFSFNGGEKSATVIDPKTDSVIKTIKLNGKPEFAVDDNGTIYVNDEDNSALIVIDAKALVVKETWPLKGCQSPSGLSADLKNRRLFSACENKIMTVTDADSGKQISTLPIGEKPDGAGFDDGLIFSSNGSGTLTVAREKSPGAYEVLQNVETRKGARTMTLDPKTHNVYLVAAKYEPKDSKMPEARPKTIPGTIEVLVFKRR